MRLTSVLVSILLCVALAHAKPSPAIDISQFHPSDIITRDVCVIGGGPSGTYAAIRLQQLGHTLVLIEKEPQLGGHTNTYIDPETGQGVDYGVLVYENEPDIISFFSHFNISTTVQSFSRLATSQRVDFRTGEPVDPPKGNSTEALERYVEQLLKYPYLSDGWDLPDPVPKDLLLPFGDFIEKYDLAPVVELITLYVQGLGDWLPYPTVYILKYFSMAVVSGIENGFLFTADHNNEALYKAARNELGDDALLSSTVVAMERSDDRPHRIVVQTPTGRKLIQAKKTIITAPQTLANLRQFDLNDRERDVFGQFEHSFYYTTVTRIRGLPNGLQIINRGVDTAYNLPPLPAVYDFSPSVVPELYVVYYGGDERTTEDEVKQYITESILKLHDTGLNVTDPEVLAFSNHSPFELAVSAEAIADGFYRDLYALQGYRQTYYAGAAFHTHDSSALWKFVEKLLVQQVVE